MMPAGRGNTAQKCRFVACLVLFFLGISSLAQQRPLKENTVPSHDSTQSLRFDYANMSVPLLKNSRIDTKHKVSDRLRKGKDSSQRFSIFKKHIAVDSADIVSVLTPYRTLFSGKPLFKAVDGVASYQFGYRSNIDTPFAEKSIGQHNTQARLNLLIRNILPISVIYWGRHSNSALFRDINDFQVSFDPNAFSNSLQEQISKRLADLSLLLRDSLTEKMIALKRNRQLELSNWLNRPSTAQRLMEANELLKIPKISYRPDLSEKENARLEDSLLKQARELFEMYDKYKSEWESVKSDLDSLTAKLDSSRQKINRLKQLAGGGAMQGLPADIESELKSMGVKNVALPPFYRWLMGVRKLSVGRTNLYHSDLTAKNISINGLNFEYNSWYYLAVTAGLIDYRFRDFVISPLKKTPQYLYMVRLGLGNLERNHVIVSGYRGQKQLFAGSVNRGGLASITTTGYSVQGRFNLSRTSYIIAEMAESVAPDFRNVPAGETTKLGFSDNSNNAYSVRLFSYLPRTKLRVEGLYKYTGANFQSFSSFQTNAGQKAWYVKADQSFFRNQLRINAAVRSADFFNPFIVQNYSNNSIFKSVTATLRKRRWPVLTVGYIPMSQVTKLNNQLIENRFQTMNVSIFHQYKIFKSRVATGLVYNRFYNTQADSGFLYYNAVNIAAAQDFFFDRFSAGINMSYTDNSSYNWLVMDERVNWNFVEWGSLGMGIKINRFQKDEIKIGGYLNGTVKVGKLDMLSFFVEKGFLPGYNGALVGNDQASIQYTRAFRFK